MPKKDEYPKEMKDKTRAKFVSQIKQKSNQMDEAVYQTKRRFAIFVMIIIGILILGVLCYALYYIAG